MSEEKKALSFVEKMKLKAQAQKNYGGDAAITDANMGARDCPNCGAARAKQDGLTKCGYCGFNFIDTTLTDGFYIKKEDNSK